VCKQAIVSINLITNPNLICVTLNHDNMLLLTEVNIDIRLHGYPKDHNLQENLWRIGHYRDLRNCIYNLSNTLGHQLFFFFFFFQITELLVFKGFQGWCVAHRITGILDFFHPPVFLIVETRCFGNWICLRPQVKEERRHLLSWTP
jgi:hypothetical protein